MSKEISPAFQFYAAEYLADENVALMSIEEEGCYIRLLAYCWREGSIPEDPELLSRLCKGSKVSSAVINRFDFPCEETGRLKHPRLEIYRENLENYRKNSAKGGRASAHKRKHKKEITKEQCTTNSLPSESQVVANTSSSSLSLSLTTNKNNQDEAFDYFKKLFQEKKSSPYISFKGDFVQLAALRKSFNISGKETPPNWQTACKNYLDSPMGSYTISEMIKGNRYAILVKSKLNQYGKPDNGNGNGNKPVETGPRYEPNEWPEVRARMVAAGQWPADKP